MPSSRAVRAAMAESYRVPQRARRESAPRFLAHGAWNIPVATVSRRDGGDHAGLAARSQEFVPELSRHSAQFALRSDRAIARRHAGQTLTPALRLQTVASGPPNGAYENVRAGVFTDLYFYDVFRIYLALGRTTAR